jgi:outer membrane protein OmpA-like peptidoglycan-associated protein
MTRDKEWVVSAASLSLGILAVGVLALSTFAHAAQEGQAGYVTPMNQTPVYRVNVVSRSVEAVNYRHRGGSTKIDFQGTSLMPDGSGEAKVDSKAGRLEINAEFKSVRNANYYGPEYLTYVLWAVTPEGRPVNLGEIVPNDKHEVRIRVTANLQAFGMIVTAEPYFAVTRPSNMTVLENSMRRDTKGWEQPVSARYDATEKGEYTVDLASNELPATGLNAQERREIPLTLMEARNSVAIAVATGAQQYAPEVLARAEDMLRRADEDYRKNRSSSTIGTLARGSTEAAEDARVLTIRRKADAQVAANQAAAEERTQQAQQQALADQQRAAEAQQQTLQAQQAAQEAQTERQAAEQAKAEALQAQQQAEAARQAALEQQQALAVQAQSAQAAAQTAQVQAQTAEQRAQAAEQDKEQMRQRLLAQLNQVLQTHDSARGLIVNMSDVLFDTGQSTLKPGAKVRLAKVAGIVQAYPDLKLQIEGYTDSTGSVGHNQELSERRAAAVRDFLIAQGVSLNNVSAQGFGPSNPVASNSTTQGRQMNRRVDLVVNGESIAARNQPATNESAPGAIAAPASPGPASSDPRQPVPEDTPNGPAGQP